MDVTRDQIQDAVKRAKAELFPSFGENSQFDDALTATAEVVTKAILLLRQGSKEIIKVDDFDFPLVLAEWAQQFTIKSHFDRVLASIYARA